MSGKKQCHQCERKVAVAKKLCDCGFAFQTLKKCYKCGVNVPIAKKICDCNYIFKQRKKPGFQEIPVVLTSDRLRPTRPIRMKRPLYNDSDYIYNVSMAALPKQRRCNANPRMFANGKICSRVGFVSTSYEHDDMYDKDLNDAALESIANSIITNSKSNTKNKVEKLYPKRERNKLAKYECHPASNIKKTKTLLSNKVKKQLKNDIEVADLGECQSNDSQTLPAEKVKRNYDTAAVSPSCNQNDSSSSNGKKSKLSNGKVSPLENGLKHLIRGEVSKAIKNKVLRSNSASPIPPASNGELSLKHIKEENTSDTEHQESKKKVSEVIKSEETSVKNNKKLIEVIEPDETLESSEKDNKKLSNISESEKTLETSEKTSVENSDGVNKRSTEKENNPSHEEKTLKELKCTDKNEIPKVPKEEEKIEEKPVKKKGGRPRIHPIRPKKPVGRPRKHPRVDAKFKRKRASAMAMNMNNSDLTNEEELPDLNYTMGINNTNISSLKRIKHSPSLDKKMIKRGRPKGCKDSKPRKIRHDYIERLIARKEDVDGLINRKTSEKKTSKGGGCFLSPPSLMASAKEKHIENEVLDDAEIERIEKRLDKTNPFIIPDNKKELYSLILGEINRRISSQSFQSSSFQSSSL